MSLAALEHTLIYGIDHEGNRVPARRRGVDYVPIHETRSTPNTTHGLEHREEAMHAAAKLTSEERDVLELLQEPIGQPVETQQKIQAGELVRFLRLGYVLVGGSTTTEKRSDGVEVDYVLVCGKERDQRSYEQIGERLGLSARQVRRRLLTANKKILYAVRR
jgi:hypothetical protein